MKPNLRLRSVIVFSLFSFLGPVFQRIPLPAFLSLHREDLAFLFWPGIVLSAGGHAAGGRDLWVSITANVVLFALLGLLTALVSKRLKTVVVIYACLCAFLTLVEAWGSGFSLAYFSWFVLIFAYLAYWLPFWAVIGTHPPQARPGSSVP
jgi:hypothetical protein